MSVPENNPFSKIIIRIDKRLPDPLHVIERLLIKLSSGNQAGMDKNKLIRFIVRQKRLEKLQMIRGIFFFLTFGASDRDIPYALSVAKPPLAR